MFSKEREKKSTIKGGGVEWRKGKVDLPSFKFVLVFNNDLSRKGEFKSDNSYLLGIVLIS